MKEFTTEELRTLVWMCQNQEAQVSIRDIKNGKKPSEDPTHQRIIEISKKAYIELINRNNHIFESCVYSCITSTSCKCSLDGYPIIDCPNYKQYKERQKNATK